MTQIAKDAGVGRESLYKRLNQADLQVLPQSAMPTAPLREGSPNRRN